MLNKLSKILIFCLQFICLNAIFCQQEYNQVIQTQFRNPVFTNLYLTEEDDLVIPYIYSVNGETRSSFFMGAFNELIDSDFSEFKIGPRPFQFVSDTLYYLSYETDTKLRLDGQVSGNEFQVIELDYPLNVERINNVDFTYSDGFFYLLNNLFISNQGWSEVEIIKIDIDGNLIWKNSFYENSSYAFSWDLEITDSNNICFVTNLLSNSFAKFSCTISCLDEHGTLKWEKTNPDDVPNGATMMGLSQIDNKIISFSEIDERDNPDYFIENLNQEPLDLVWRDSENGDFLFNETITTDAEEDLRVLNMKTIYGGNIVIMGYFFDGNENLISGYVDLRDKNGNSIWNNKFLSKPQAKNSKIHYILDVETPDNESLITMGTVIDNEIDSTLLWLMKLNNLGELITSTVNEVKNESSIQLLANPAENELIFKNDSPLLNSYACIYNQQSQRILRFQISNLTNRIDISSFSPGTYFLVIEADFPITKRFIKL